MDVPISVKAVGQTVYDDVATAIGADTVTFNAQNVRLLVTDLTPSRNYVPVGSDYSTFHGMGPIVSSGTSLQVSVDPLTGDRLFRLKPPAGGWRWISSGGGVPYVPTTYYGWIWLDSTEGAMVAMAKFDAAVLVNADGQSIEVDSVEFRLPVGGLR